MARATLSTWDVTRGGAPRSMSIIFPAWVGAGGGGGVGCRGPIPRPAGGGGGGKQGRWARAPVGRGRGGAENAGPAGDKDRAVGVHDRCAPTPYRAVIWSAWSQCWTRP